MTRVHGSAWLFVGAVGLVPTTVEGSNERHDRTPVVWRGTNACAPPELEPPCMILHDRSQNVTLHLPYGIFKEDALTAADEVADSRTHQFHAFCRQHSPRTALPNWISLADVDTAAAIDIVEAGSVSPEDVLETSTQWEDCWWRLNADDERRAITCEMADAGIDWDTSAVPAGVYTIEGFTNEPAANLWRTRPGVIKVHDGDPDAVGPAAAITTGELVVYRNDVEIIEGCVDAVAGTTFTVFYGIELEDETVQWSEYLVDIPITGPTFEFELDPPADLIGETTLLRADFTDPRGRSTTSFMGVPIVVYDLDNPMGCDEGGGFIGGDHCNDGDDTSGTAGTSIGASEDGASSSEATSADATQGSDTTSASADDPAPAGCGCDQGGGACAGLWLPLAWRRRPSRSRDRPRNDEGPGDVSEAFE